jgi:hypothetical protein
MAVLTNQELGALVPSLCGIEEPRATLLIAGAQAAAEKYCNRSFATSAEAAEYYNWPSPGSRLDIPLNRRPVSAVSEVKIDPRGGAGQLDDTFGSTTVLDSGTDYYCDYNAGILRLLTTRSNWPIASFGFGGQLMTGQPFAYNTNLRGQNTGTIKVTYTAGYSSVPADVKLAIAQMVSWLAGTGMESGGTGGVTSYIDVSVATGAAMDELSYGKSPSLGSARQILGYYREPTFSRSPW